MATTVQLDDMLTPDELGKRWGLEVGTLANWRRAGKGPKFVTLGNGKRARVRYKVADVLAYEQQQQKEPS